MRKHLVLLGLLTACSRTFTAPVPEAVDGGPPPPSLTALSPQQVFANQAVVLTGANFSTLASEDEVRVGTLLAELDPDAGVTDQALTFRVPNLGPAAQKVNVSVTVRGETTLTLPLQYLGPGHPQSLTAQRVSDLSPTPTALAVDGPYQAVALAGIDALTLFDASTQVETCFRGTQLTASVDLFAQGAAASATFVQYPPDLGVADLLRVNLGPDGNATSQNLGPVLNPNELVFTSQGNYALGRGVGPVASLGTVDLSAGGGVVLGSSAALDANGALTLAAALVTRPLTGLELDFLAPLADGSLTDGGSVGFPSDGGVFSGQPRNLVLAPGGGEVAFVVDVGPYSVAVELSTNLAAPNVQAVAGSHFAPALIALSDQGLALATNVTSEVSFYDFDGGLVRTVPVAGVPLEVTADLAAPHDFAVATADPPAILEFDATGELVDQRTLSSIVDGVALSPDGTRAAASMALVPRVLALDPGSLSVRPGGVNVTSLLSGAATPSDGDPDLADTTQMLFLGDGALCATLSMGSNVQVRCANELSLFEPTGCVPLIAPSASVLLRGDGDDGLVIYRGNHATRFAVSTSTDERGALQYACDPTAGVDLPDQAPATTDWTALATSPDGASRLEISPSHGIVFTQQGATTQLCTGTANRTDASVYGLDCTVLQAAEARVSPDGTQAMVRFGSRFAFYSVGESPDGGGTYLPGGQVPGDEILSDTFSPDGTRFYVGTALGRVLEFDTADFQGAGSSNATPPLRSAALGFPVGLLTFDPTGSRLLLVHALTDEIWSVQ